MTNKFEQEYILTRQLKMDGRNRLIEGKKLRVELES